MTLNSNLGRSNSQVGYRLDLNKSVYKLLGVKPVSVP